MELAECAFQATCNLVGELLALQPKPLKLPMGDKAVIYRRDPNEWTVIRTNPPINRKYLDWPRPTILVSCNDKPIVAIVVRNWELHRYWSQKQIERMVVQPFIPVASVPCILLLLTTNDKFPKKWRSLIEECKINIRPVHPLPLPEKESSLDSSILEMREILKDYVTADRLNKEAYDIEFPIKLQGKKFNELKKRSLERPVFKVLLKLIDLYTDNQHKIQTNNGQVVARWPRGITLTYHRHNTEKDTSVPDFVVARHHKTLAVIECKNVNPEFVVGASRKWFETQFLSRFQKYKRDRKCKKFGIFSFFRLIPDPDYGDEVLRRLERERVDIIELGEQPIDQTQEEADATVNRLLFIIIPKNPKFGNLTKALQTLKRVRVKRRPVVQN